VKICELLCRSSETIFNQPARENDEGHEIPREDSGESTRVQQETEIASLMSKIFFVVCTLFQSANRERRLLAHRTLAAFPRRQFVESDLAILLGETLLRDSMDQDLLIASLGVKGLFWYTNTSDLWEGSVMKWLTHPSNVIRESCLIGLLDILTRVHYGWEPGATAKVSHQNEATADRLWTSISHIAPVLEDIISPPANEIEPNREIEILRERCPDLATLSAPSLPSPLLIPRMVCLCPTFPREVLTCGRKRSYRI
jgi:hypothetical protein